MKALRGVLIVVGILVVTVVVVHFYEEGLAPNPTLTPTSTSTFWAPTFGTPSSTPTTPTITPTLWTPYPTLTLTPTPSLTPKAHFCEWFDPEFMPLTLYNIQPGSTDLTLYVYNQSGWPGLEFKDTVEWTYTAFIGDVEAESCRFEDYAGRLYCYFKNLPMYMMDTTQELKILSNNCPLIIQFELVSIIGPKESPTPPLPACKKSFNKSKCEAAGGIYTCVFSCFCKCP